MRLIPWPPGRIVGGAVRFQGRDLVTLSDAEMRKVRGRQIGMVFQEPMTSLNPVLTIGLQLTETVRHHLGVTQEEADKRAIELLGLVGISEPARRLKQYPHHLSGGMRQRVMIALALSCEPKLIIADEPTTALDVTIQAQILELMKDLTKRFGVALVIITHNLGVVARYADRVNVMYAGKIVENGTAADIYHRPVHPYTLGLLRSVPRMDRPRSERLVPIRGQPPDLMREIEGCAYRPRCDYAVARCERDVPPLEAYARTVMAAVRRHFGNRIPELIVEPGRSLVGDAGVIKTEVVLISRKSADDATRWVYLDVGKFGGLAETMDESIRYPILPDVEVQDADAPNCPGCVEEILHLRHHTLFVPRDFDVSPYFEVIKFNVIAPGRFDYQHIRWADD